MGLEPLVGTARLWLLCSLAAARVAMFAIHERQRGMLRLNFWDGAPGEEAKAVKTVNCGLEKKGTMVEYDDDGNEIKAVVDIICMIPGVATEGNQRVPLPSSHSFEDALEVIYETIGCVSMARKLILAYKLSLAKENWKFGYITLFIVHISPPSQKFTLFESVPSLLGGVE
ncbi:hypothetical protein K438DRAFT_1780710 [Mycena galopus ATCC 62051]|nr:hypothetical protein K438DRAFT_2141407 [Mycena galopus ATCC 62051]KAF8146698.1 hypothetical protein K438DRAFT_1780710 [Mycena galopus ATCC 62051]